MRSAVTAADTISSRTEENVRIEPPARTRASITVVEPEPTRSSRMTQATHASTTSTAEYPDETGRRRKNRESISSRASSRNGCTIQ
ncbi:hypothetical protein AURDEDRAFT_113223 [Auricularia subglabra TFB-10046 SS5]|nr:hypothetical protein AURDEDRAFT_113223 [Auricularia subglabra TFB-10046 SS5]